MASGMTSLTSTSSRSSSRWNGRWLNVAFRSACCTCMALTTAAISLLRRVCLVRPALRFHSSRYRSSTPTSRLSASTCAYPPPAAAPGCEAAVWERSTLRSTAMRRKRSVTSSPFSHPCCSSWVTSWSTARSSVLCPRAIHLSSQNCTCSLSPAGSSGSLALPTGTILRSWSLDLSRGAPARVGAMPRARLRASSNSRTIPSVGFRPDTWAILVRASSSPMHSLAETTRFSTRQCWSMATMASMAGWLRPRSMILIISSVYSGAEMMRRRAVTRATVRSRLSFLSASACASQEVHSLATRLVTSLSEERHATSHSTPSTQRPNLEES
mmetsp:Transcript_58172/g.136856  ORF Transcript_58172/g.136856 Transcript_58172/m.136856 type:complete len:327 (-) Transcript_58172:1234-2214(-)